MNKPLPRLAFCGSAKRTPLLLAGIALLTACVSSPERREAAQIARAKADLAKNDLKSAIIEYKVASQNMPKDAEPVYQLGMIYLGTGSEKQAVESFENVIRLNPKHSGALLQLALVKVASSRPDVVEEAKKSLSALLVAHPGDAEVTASLALAEAKLGNKTEAWKMLKAAEEKNPANMRPAGAIAGYYMANGDRAAAKQITRDLAEAVPNSAEAAVLRGEIAFALQDFADTDAQVSRALALKGDFRPALDLRLRRELMTENHEGAERTAQTLSKLPEEATWGSYARMLFAEGKVDQGIAEFKRLLKEHNDALPLRDEYAYALLKAHRSNEALAVVEETLQKHSDDKVALLERAALNIDKGNIDAGARDTKTLRDAKAISGELCFQESRIYAAHNQSSREGDLLVEALRYEPRLLKARTELARVLTGAGQTKNALATLDQATPQEKRTLDYVYFHNMALIGAGDFNEARKGVDAGLATAPQSPEFLQQDGVLRILARDWAGARKSLESAFLISPSDVGTLKLLGQVMKQQNEAPLFARLMREAAAKNPKSAALQRFLGVELVNQGDVKGGRAALEAAKAAGDVIEPENDIAELDMRSGALDAAKQRLANLVKTHENAHSRFMLAQIAAFQGSTSETIAAEYLKVLDLEPSNVFAMNNLANTLASSPKKYDDALFWAKKALGVAPPNLSPAVEDTIGWIYYKQGKYDDALPFLRKSLQSFDRPLAHYHLAGALLKAGDAARGRVEYEVALKQNPRDGARGEVGPLFETR